MSVSFISSEKLKQFLNMEDSDDVVAEVYKLIDIVLSRYFSSYDADIEELRAVAIHSCWQLAVRGDYNQEMSPLNYLMTRIRNSIHNFLTKKKELAVEELPETPVYDSCFSEAVLEFIKLEIQHLEVYFSDKVLRLLDGWALSLINCESLVSSIDLSEVDVEEYIFATNMLRYRVFCKFLKGDVYRSPLLELLRRSGVSEGFLGVLLNIFTEEELEKFVVLLSGVSRFRIPSVSVLTKTDTYLEIVKLAEEGMTVEQLSLRFKKSQKTIVSILKRFGYESGA